MRKETHRGSLAKDDPKDQRKDSRCKRWGVVRRDSTKEKANDHASEYGRRGRLMERIHTSLAVDRSGRRNGRKICNPWSIRVCEMSRACQKWGRGLSQYSCPKRVSESGESDQSGRAQQWWCSKPMRVASSGGARRVTSKGVYRCSCAIGAQRE